MNILSSARFSEIVEQFPQIDPVMVVGDLGLDKYTYGDVARISPEAPVPVLDVSKEWLKLGMASNVSDNLKSLNVKTTLCGVIGDDLGAENFLQLMQQNGLPIDGVIKEQSRKTSLKERIVTNTQQICRVDHETIGAISDKCFGNLLNKIEELIDNQSAIILEDYAKGLVSEKLCQRLIAMANERGKMIAVDPSRKTPPLWYKGVTLLKPNQVESQIIVDGLGYFNERNLETMASIIVDKLKVEKLLITLGSDGMALLDSKTDGKLKIIPTAANEVFDVSGAGDTAISAIVSSIVAGASLAEAAWIGNCASGVAVSKKGTANVSVEELKDFYQTIIKKIEK